MVERQPRTLTVMISIPSAAASSALERPRSYSGTLVSMWADVPSFESIVINNITVDEKRIC